MCIPVLQCIAVCCRVLQCVAEYGSVLQCVAVCDGVLQCNAVCSFTWLTQCHSPGSVASRTILWTNLRSTASGWLAYMPSHAYSTLGVWILSNSIIVLRHMCEYIRRDTCPCTPSLRWACGQLSNKVGFSHTYTYISLCTTWACGQLSNMVVWGYICLSGYMPLHTFPVVGL
jgi:hypothetical protein